MGKVMKHKLVVLLFGLLGCLGSYANDFLTYSENFGGSVYLTDDTDMSKDDEKHIVIKLVVTRDKPFIVGDNVNSSFLYNCKTSSAIFINVLYRNGEKIDSNFDFIAGPNIEAKTICAIKNNKKLIEYFNNSNVFN